jgi:hypothetical protein
LKGCRRGKNQCGQKNPLHVNLQLFTECTALLRGVVDVIAEGENPLGEYTFILATRTVRRRE